MAKRELQFNDDKSQKFWTIVLKGMSHTVSFGRIGTNGQTRTKEFGTQQEAKKSYDKLVEQKLDKGYVDAKKQVTVSNKKGVKKSKTTRKRQCQRPTPFERLRYDKQFEFHRTTLKHNKHEIEFSILVEDQYTLDDAIPVAKKLWAERVQRFKDAQALAADEQLERINCFLGQLHPGLPQLTKPQFRKLVAVPSSIRLEMDEDQIWFEFVYHSDSFGEHCVNVAINLTYDSMNSDTQCLY